MNKEIKCPHCGDTWKYKVIIDHETGKAVLNECGKIIEDWEEPVCYKCHKHYKLNLSKVDVKMWDFIYKAWRIVKGS